MLGYGSNGEGAIKGQLKALLNLIGCEGEGRHRGEEERKKKKKEEERRGRKKGGVQEEEQQTTGKFCDKSEKMLRRRWGRKQPPVAKELPEEGASVTMQSPENHSFRPLEITGSTSGEIQPVYREVRPVNSEIRPMNS
ncbi:hypothetical protein PIB30_100022 [Stylosanthes scabra]|uniref:Uncharacterized protein n=1 Tax=Stylosanthes scabra TaxID=79078 RepID=A0ABU6W057_9FABA|nr:hypothetical protein [Stylosanthes scabra]